MTAAEDRWHQRRHVSLDSTHAINMNMNMNMNMNISDIESCVVKVSLPAADGGIALLDVTRVPSGRVVRRALGRVLVRDHPVRADRPHRSRS